VIDSMTMKINPHTAPVSRMLAPDRYVWAQGWTESHSCSYGSKEARVQARMDKPGPGYWCNMRIFSKRHGMTLIELVIVLAVMGILLAIAVPGYGSYMLRVHRTEAIGMLLQASMCQERVYASSGNYDTNQCLPVSEHQRYRIIYTVPDSRDRSYVAMATPRGAQLSDPCGSLSLDQSGSRGISATGISIMKCWNGR